MSYSKDIPVCCINCKVMRNYDCFMQEICTKVKMYRRKKTEAELTGQMVEGIARYKKRVRNCTSYKGGAM